MKHTPDQLKAAHLRRRRIVAAIDTLAKEQATAKAALAAAGHTPTYIADNDGLLLLAQVVGLWGDEAPEEVPHA